jgi:hypothetical protein
MKRARGSIARVAVSALTGICLLAATVHASIAIKPAFVEVKMDEGRPSGMFLISNVGETVERFRVNASYFTYSESGQLHQSPTGEYSLASWIHFNPRELTLAPKTQRAVRFAIVPRGGRLLEGEWWAAMELESLLVNDIVSQDEQTGRTARVKTLTRFLVPIFGTVGKTSYEGHVKDLQVQIENGVVVLKALIAATGTGRLRVEGNYEIADITGKVIDSGPFALGYVLRGGQRWFARKIDAAVPQGTYTVRVSLQAPQVERPLVGEATVIWPQLPPVEVAAALIGPAVQPAPAAEQPDQSDSSREGNE